MRLGKSSWETTPRALIPRDSLRATLLICCRLRGVSEEEKFKQTTVNLCHYLSAILKINTCITLTLIELQAEISWRSQVGVVDWFFVQVISGIHIPPKLYQQLNQIHILCFGCVVKRCLVKLGSVYICPWKRKTKLSSAGRIRKKHFRITHVKLKVLQLLLCVKVYFSFQHQLIYMTNRICLFTSCTKVGRSVNVMSCWLLYYQ